ncbi:MAG TPA: PAS domain S-box protein [Tepidisphaeraceae bacterium]|jgi:PAS domain S-box-containing protein
MFEGPRGRVVAYGMALLAPAASLLVRWPLWPVLGDAVPHMTFFPAVMIAAYFGGFWPGVVATFFSAIAANFFITGQVLSFHAYSVDHVAAMILFVLVGIVTSELCESLHRARRRIVAAERRRAEETVRETENRFRQIAENIHEIFWVMDPDHNRVIYVSPGYDELWGRSSQSLREQPRSWIESIHPDDLPTVIDNLEQRSRGVFNDMEFRITRPDGSIRWIRSRGFPMQDHTGKTPRIAGLAEDVTERKRAESAVRESEERFRGTFENAAVGIAHTDLDGRWLRVNEKLCAVLGYTVEEALRLHWQDVTYPEDRLASNEQLTALLHDRQPSYSLEKRYVRKDGSVIWGQVDVSLQRDATGRPAYSIAMIQDITERKRLERELRQAKEAAEAANRAKDDFLANVSHEIRTPMNAIIGMTELVLDTPLADEQRQNLKTVKTAADNLLGIINDLLDFSKIEAGRLELDMGDFSLRSAMGETLRALAVRAHRKGLELVCNVQPDVPDALVGDAGRLRQVLLNLVGNAIKFTDAGEVVVHIEPSPDAGPDNRIGVRFKVRDTGVGISPEKQSTIFRAFEQEDTSTTRKYGGTGLGLTIASRLVALMGGTITVESEPGRGSTFCFNAWFGRQVNPPVRVAAASPVVLHNLRVLVVDDNAVNRLVLEKWLRRWQMEPVCVGDGMAAMDALWHAASAGRPYPLILLDARMPDTDGITLAGKIRERVELSASRVILLTSGERPGDLARLGESRVDGHLLKPVQQDELLETIYSTMSRPQDDEPQGHGGAPSHRTGSTSTGAVKPLRILVAEDSELNAQLMEKLFVKRGHSVRLASNGREALDLASTADFDLMFLDVHMPELDGFEVIHAIRERERTAGSHLPVIALTARSRPEDRERCIDAGMDDFLSKPIHADALWAAIDRVSPPALPADRNGAGLLAPNVLLAACDGDEDILRSICQRLRDTLPGQLAAVRDALLSGNASRLRESAHKLAGMVSAFSTVAGGIASEIEDHAAGGHLDEASPLVEQLQSAVHELMRQLADGLTVESLRRAAATTGSR